MDTTTSLPSRNRVTFWVLSLFVFYSTIQSLASIRRKDIASEAQLGRLDLPTTVAAPRTRRATDNNTATVTTTTTTSACNRTYNVVVSGNDAYLEDFLTFWYHCQKTGLCCDPRLPECCSIATFYAEDEAIFRKLEPSKILRVKKSWETGTVYNNANLTGRGRFTYSKHMRFNQMVSRRPTLLLIELTKAQEQYGTNKMLVVYFDLDTFVLKDPRPYFEGDYDFWGHDAINNVSGPFNTGMLAMRPTNGTIRVITDWRNRLESRNKSPTTNQKAFNEMVKKRNATVKAKMLPVSKFLAGQRYEHFDTGLLQPLEEDMVFFHNNYCDKNCSKVQRAKTLGLWHPVDFQDIMG